MTDNEKLIEEAASIVYGTVPASVMVPWHELDTNRRVEFEDAARAIRAVFEKAHEKYLEREDAEYGALFEKLEAEPEWEYGLRLHPRGRVNTGTNSALYVPPTTPHISMERAIEMARLNPAYRPTFHRRRRAGLWETVDQGGVPS